MGEHTYSMNIKGTATDPDVRSATNPQPDGPVPPAKRARSRASMDNDDEDYTDTHGGTEQKKKCTTCGSRRQLSEFEMGRATCTRCLKRKRKDNYAAPCAGKARCSTCRREQDLENFGQGAATCNKCLDRKRAKRRRKTAPARTVPPMVRVSSFDMALISAAEASTDAESPPKSPSLEAGLKASPQMMDICADMGLPAFQRKLSDLDPEHVARVLSELEDPDADAAAATLVPDSKPTSVGDFGDFDLLDWLRIDTVVAERAPMLTPGQRCDGTCCGRKGCWAHVRERTSADSEANSVSSASSEEDSHAMSSYLERSFGLAPMQNPVLPSVLVQPQSPSLMVPVVHPVK